MTRDWSQDELDKITPPQVKDARGRGFLAALNGVFQSQDLNRLKVRNFDLCPGAALPALIAEMSMEEFIEPGLPELVQRRILKNWHELKKFKGTDHGVALGLELLGMRGDIVQWWMTEPKGLPDTHEITFTVGEALFDEEAILGPRIIAAAHRMIEATKRFSQESHIRIRVEQKSALSVSTAARSVEVQRPKGVAARPTDFANDVDISAHARAVHILRFDGEAA